MRAAVLIALAVLTALPPTADATFPGKNGDLLVTDRTYGHAVDDYSSLRRIDSASGDVSQTPICGQAPGGPFSQPGCGGVGPPAASPDGASVAVVARDFDYYEPFLPPRWHVRVLSLATGGWRLVPLPVAKLGYGLIVRWTPELNFAFEASGHRILAVADTGTPLGSIATRASAPDVSSTGGLAFVRRGSVWTSRGRGTAQRLAQGGQPSWSPRGSRVAFTRKGWIYTVRAAGGKPHRLTRGFHPTWSPDGRQIAFFNAVPDANDFGRDSTFVFALNRATGRVRRVSSEPIVLEGEIPPNGLDWQPSPAR